VFLLLGVAARVWLGFEPGPVVGLVAGLLAAQFVPASGSCVVPRRPRS